MNSPLDPKASPDEAARQDLRLTFQRLWAFVQPHRWGLSLSVLGFALAACTEPLIPAMLKVVLDDGFAKDASLPLWTVGAALVGLFFLRGLFAFVGTYMLERTTTRTVLGLRRELLQSVIRADAALYAHLSPSAAVTRVVNNPQEVTSLLGRSMVTLLRDGITTVVMLAYLFYLNWTLTLLSLITMPLLAVVVKAIHKRAKRLGTQAYESQLSLVSVVDDIARAWRVVRSFGAGPWETQRFDAEARRLQRLTLKNAAANALMSPASQLVASLGVALILTLALMQARETGATIGEFVAFIVALLTLVSKARHLTDVSQPIVSALIIARGCFELMDTPAEPDPGTQSLSWPPKHIGLQQLSVQYPGAEGPALDRIDMNIRAGQTLALVGTSGAGKTTLINVLLGFVRPTQGSIAFDGIPIESLSKASLREQFAVVSQDTVLFDGSLADNICYAAGRDEGKLAQCIRAAHLDELVDRWPLGVETRIGANGSLLSGGQRQRVAIARALYKDAPIWIFDEATSALDTESERAVQQAIEEWMGNKTIILIAHRLSTVRNADCIYVMGQGRVLEQGNHQALLDLGGAYAAMIQAQR